jgi:hypothetical protein
LLLLLLSAHHFKQLAAVLNKRYKILSKTLQCNGILDLNRRQRQNIHICSRLMCVTYMTNKDSTKCTVQKESSTITLHTFKWNFCTEFFHEIIRKKAKFEKGQTQLCMIEGLFLNLVHGWIDSFYNVLFISNFNLNM